MNLSSTTTIAFLVAFPKWDALEAGLLTAETKPRQQKMLILKDLTCHQRAAIIS